MPRPRLQTLVIPDLHLAAGIRALRIRRPPQRRAMRLPGIRPRHACQVRMDLLGQEVGQALKSRRPPDLN
jgi:hypothetical protein